MTTAQGAVGPAARTPIQGKIDVPAHIATMMRQKPLETRNLALDDWGQAPWKVQSIISEASLLMERNSGDDAKRTLASETKAAIWERISSMKEHYVKVVEANGGGSEVARKLADDISFSENMLAFIESQVNGLVSLQKSWKLSSDAVKRRYEQQLELKGPWGWVKKYVPWVATAVGVGVGAAAWAVNGWDTFVQGVQFIIKAGHMNPEFVQFIDPTTRGLFAAGSMLGLGWLSSKVLGSQTAIGLYLQYLGKAGELLKKNAKPLFWAAGIAAGAAAFFTGQLDSAAQFAQNGWKWAHMNPEIVQFIDPIVKAVFNFGGIFGFAWAATRLDRRGFERRQKLLDECEAKQTLIVKEEKAVREQVFALIKEKAVELCAKYGYLLELLAEDPEMAELTEKQDFAGIKALHRQRVKHALGRDVSESQLAGLETDSRSSVIADSIVALAEAPAEESPKPASGPAPAS